jgi:hypothetical protein
VVGVVLRCDGEGSCVRSLWLAGLRLVFGTFSRQPSSFFLGPTGREAALTGVDDMSRAFCKPLSVFGDAGGDFELTLGLGNTVSLDERSSIITAGVLEALTSKTKEAHRLVFWMKVSVGPVLRETEWGWDLQKALE